MTIEERNDLVMSCLPMAWKLTRTFARNAEHRRDLVSVASLALVRVSRVYDPGKGVGFTTCAYRAIMNALLIEQRNERVNYKRLVRWLFSDGWPADRSSLPGERNDYLDLLPAAIAQLPPLEHRIASGLLRGKKPAEMGLNVYQYMVAYKRTIKELRRKLEAV